MPFFKVRGEARLQDIFFSAIRGSVEGSAVRLFAVFLGVSFLFFSLFLFSIPPLLSSSLCAMLIASRFRCPFPLVHKRVSVCVLGHSLKITWRTHADARCLMSSRLNPSAQEPSWGKGMD